MMKTIRLSLRYVLFVVAITVFAACSSINHIKGDIIGYARNGYIMDKDNHVIGYYKNGYIFDTDHNVTGTYGNGYVYNSSDSIIARYSNGYILQPTK